MRVVMKKRTAEDEGPDCLDDDDVDVGAFFGEKKSMWSSFNTFLAYVI